MDIAFSQAQEMLRRSTREFLERECPGSLVREMEQDPAGYSPDLWRKMAGLGWLGMLFPEEYGGSGADLVDAALILEEIGYAALPGPFFATALSGLLILEGGSEAQRQRLLPAVARGELFLSPALWEAEGSFDPGGITTRALRRGKGYRVRGLKNFVPDAHLARYFLCLARQGGGPEKGLSLFLVEARHPSVRLTPLATTAADRQFQVALEGTPVPGEDLLGEAGKGGEAVGRALEKATVLKSAEMVGGAQAALDLALDYARKRVQFGRPIGSFQAVQHHLVDMYRDIQLARLLTLQAAWKLAQGQEAGREVSLAKLMASQAYPAVTRLAHQIHGGVGFYAEYDLELYYRRAVAGWVTLGTPDYHRERLGEWLSSPGLLLH